MYAIYDYIDPRNHPNVGIYGIHGVFEIYVCGQTIGHPCIHGPPTNMKHIRHLDLQSDYYGPENPYGSDLLHPSCWGPNQTLFVRAGG